MKTIIIITAAIMAGLISAAVSAEEGLPVTFFYSPSCHECVKVKAEYMTAIEERFKGKISLSYRDITDIENYTMLVSLKEQYGMDAGLKVPIVFLHGRFLSGEDQITGQLGSVIEAALGNASASGQVVAPPVDLVSRFLKFTPLAIITAGLVDGINPCAFAVIIFFVSFLSLQGYRKNQIVVIGLFFVLAVFLAYLLIGLGLFNFLYRLQGFWRVVKTINIAIGMLSIVLGMIALYDFFMFRKTGHAEDTLLQLPQGLKNKIHAVIGWQYRRPRDSSSEKIGLVRLAASAFISGGLVSILEAVCTGQVYLPTITFVFKATHLKWEAFSYLIVYNIMFIVPLLLIFLVVLLGVTSQQLSQLFKRHFLAIKLAMAVVFFGLGFYLTWRA